MHKIDVMVCRGLKKNPVGLTPLGLSMLPSQGFPAFSALARALPSVSMGLSRVRVWGAS